MDETNGFVKRDCTVGYEGKRTNDFCIATGYMGNFVSGHKSSHKGREGVASLRRVGGHMVYMTLRLYISRSFT